jgi:uncharacterized membrane-anchored protein YhcB (DUF1043 family)
MNGFTDMGILKEKQRLETENAKLKEALRNARRRLEDHFDNAGKLDAYVCQAYDHVMKGVNA